VGGRICVGLAAPAPSLALLWRGSVLSLAFPTEILSSSPKKIAAGKLPKAEQGLLFSAYGFLSGCPRPT